MSINSLYSRRILLAVTGLSPQVVTETLYALAVNSEQPFIPTEIHVITTLEGSERARLSLLDKITGHFHRLCREYELPNIDFSSKNIHVISDKSGQSLADIRSPEDNLNAADFIAEKVRDFCADSNSSLHVSIAGGRKSMGFFVGYALSLFGRDQDNLSHVLVSDPFESLPDFFFPPPIGKVLHTRDGRPIHTDEAKIMLAPIPFVRLNGGIPNSLVTGRVSFAETVAVIQAAIEVPMLTLDTVNCLLMCGGRSVKLQPANFAFYWWLVDRCLAGLPNNGAVNWRQTDAKDYLKIYSKITLPSSGRFEKAEKSLKYGFDSGEFFEQRASKINRIIKQTLPMNGAEYQIKASEAVDCTQYYIAVPSHRIHLMDSVRNNFETSKSY